MGDPPTAPASAQSYRSPACRRPSNPQRHPLRPAYRLRVARAPFGQYAREVWRRLHRPSAVTTLAAGGRLAAYPPVAARYAETDEADRLVLWVARWLVRTRQKGGDAVGLTGK